MRILHLIPSLNPADGGPVTAVHDIIRATARQGCSSEVVSLDPPEAPWLGCTNFSVTAVGPGRGVLRVSRELKDWMCENSARFDVVVVHGIWLYPTQCAQECWRQTGLPYVVYTHGMLDITHRRVFPFRHLKKSLRWLTRERSALSDAAALLFTCEAERELAADTFWPKLSLRTAQIAPYCVEPPPNDAETQVRAFHFAFPDLKDSRFLLFLSRIHPKKGVDLLLEAFSHCASRDPHLKLMVAGPGDAQYVEKLMRKVSKSQIADRVIWPGMLVGDLKWGALRSAELFCLTSHQENFGIAITESLACGTPVLVSRRVNIAQQIYDADAAIICHDDHVSTTEALLRWLEMPNVEKYKMKCATTTCFETQFHSDVAASRFLNVIEMSIPATRNREVVLNAQFQRTPLTTD